jgi:hypothetical protein
VSHKKIVKPDRHNRAYDFDGQGGSDSSRMTYQNIFLQGQDFVFGNNLVAQRTKACRYAVNDTLFLHPAIDHRAGFGYPIFTGFSVVNGALISGDMDEIFYF